MVWSRSWRIPRNRRRRDLAALLLQLAPDGSHFGFNLLARDDFLLDDEIADGADPFLVVGRRIVFLLAVVLDHAAHGVDLEGRFLGTNQQVEDGIHALFP